MNGVTGQVDFGSHANLLVEQTVALVNELVPGESRGRPYAPPADPDELRARLGTVLPARDGTPPRTDEDLKSFADLAAELRSVFVAAGRGDLDTAAVTLNAMIERFHALPMLLRHDGDPWHLHFHRPNPSPIVGWGGSMAVGLAFVLGSEYADRIGVCSAPSCDRVYVDTSRNGTKRFCCTACQNRVKAAAFRARHGTA
jgi:hypothetical protein